MEDPETCGAELDSILGTECPACGDTYHNMERHLELNYKGCADALLTGGTR